MRDPMGQFQPTFEPSTVWLRSLIAAMDEVASSKEKPSAPDIAALANRLELPAMPEVHAHSLGKASSKGLRFGR
jgi:hypothetical protein